MKMKYIEIARLYHSLESTSKRLTKTDILSRFLKKIPKEELRTVMLLLRGKVFLGSSEKKTGVSDKQVIKAINVTTGLDRPKILSQWKKMGDLGLVCEHALSNRNQVSLFSEELSVDKVFLNLSKLAEAIGQGSVNVKVKLIAELLSHAKPLEGKYIVRTVVEDLRMGVGDGIIRDSIVWANFSKELGIVYSEKDNKLILPDDRRDRYNDYVNSVQGAYNINDDFGEIAQIIAENGLDGLKEIKIVPGKPVKVMLYQKAADIEEGFKQVGAPCAIEYKYDGFRLLIHVDGGKIDLFTRKLENVTSQFPDVVDFVAKNVKVQSAVIDSEAVGYDKKHNRFVPFQNISQRIKRKHGISEMAKKIPVELVVFDILYHDGKEQINRPYNERRALISKIIEPVTNKIGLSRVMITDNRDDAHKFYEESLDAGNEGIMMKNLEAAYKPGSRVGYGVKVKPVMETLDLAIVGAEWGEGKRAKWLTSFTVACIDDDGSLLEIGRVSTGIKELSGAGTSYQEMTDILLPLKREEEGKRVSLKPKLVIEVKFEEIQKSPTYSSGFALRFPRFVRLREDRGISDCSTLEFVKDLYYEQK
jgi:DNA ligase-1